MHLKLAFGREELQFEFADDAPVTVAQVLESVKGKRPETYARWCNRAGELRRSLAVFVNREHVRYSQGFETELSDGDEVYVIPTLAGG
jgi:molybdopterin converting factor small subunit